MVVFVVKYLIDEAESYRNILQQLYSNILSLIWFWMPLSLRPINMRDGPVGNSTRINHLDIQSEDYVRYAESKSNLKMQSGKKFSPGKRWAGNVHQQCNCGPLLAVIIKNANINAYKLPTIFTKIHSSKIIKTYLNNVSLCTLIGPTIWVKFLIECISSKNWKEKGRGETSKL